MNLVDTLEEQRVLEKLLDESKPPDATPRPLHYLLRTPFRYPPLMYGSRFGTTLERGIFYGSLRLETAFAETAFYSLLFRDHSAGLSEITAQKTAFSFSYAASRFLDTTAEPFAPFRAGLVSPSDYTVPQTIGQKMREQRGQALLFRSVRCLNHGDNLAIFDPNVFKGDPMDLRGFRMDLRGDQVSFLAHFGDTSFTFHRNDFDAREVFSHPSRV